MRDLVPGQRLTHVRRTLTARRLAGAVMLTLLVTYALAWPALAPPTLTGTDYLAADLPPSFSHPLGTDGVGHDLSVRVAEALRVSLAVATGAALLAAGLGVTVGAAAAAGGQRVDALLMRATDAVAAIPHLLATVVVVALFRDSLTALLVALAATHWPTVARVVRADAQSVMASGYVRATQVAGAGPCQVLRHHVLPAVAGQAGLAVVLMVPHAVWHESTLSFLGIGMPPERPSLGTLVSLSQAGLLLGQWWSLVFPTAALIAVTTAVALLGSGRRSGRRRADRRFALVGSWWRSPRGPRRLRRQQRHGPSHSHSHHNRLPQVGHIVTGLAVDDLEIRYPGDATAPVVALRQTTLRVLPGQIVAVTGPSGAGKSSLVDACVRATAPGSAGTSARPESTRFTDAHLSGSVRAGGHVGHVPQLAAGAFTPTRHIRGQLEESLAAAPNRSVPTPLPPVDGLCHMVGLDPALADRYPHQLSGGQLRRMALAAALSCNPAVLVADEPTAGLDRDAAVSVFALLRELADRTGLAVLLTTHDLDALTVSGVADETAELRHGRLRTAASRPRSEAPELVSP